MKTRIVLLAMMLFCSCFATSLKAAEKTMTREQAQTRVTEIQQRVEAIRALDIQHLSTAERKGLKTELKDMKKELRALDGYIYVSAGALILIIILLILLL